MRLYCVEVEEIRTARACIAAPSIRLHPTEDGFHAFITNMHAHHTHNMQIVVFRFNNPIYIDVYMFFPLLLLIIIIIIFNNKNNNKKIMKQAAFNEKMKYNFRKN
jgi:hypothetical protein